MRLKNKHKPSLKLRFIVIAVVVLALIAGAAVFAYSLKTASDTDTKQKHTEKISPEGVNYNTSTSDQQAAGSTQKAKAQEEPETPSSSQPIGVTITALNQSDGVVQIRTLIDTVSDTGTCTATLTKSGAAVTKQSGMQAGPSSSTCQGFDIPRDELSAGEWQVAISVQAGTRSGSASKTLTVQ